MVCLCDIFEYDSGKVCFKVVVDIFVYGYNFFKWFGLVML